jgi:hypothetical protein
MISRMPDTRTIAALEAERYAWIAAGCCKGTFWVPSRLIPRESPSLLSRP